MFLTHIYGQLLIIVAGAVRPNTSVIDPSHDHGISK